MDGGIALARPPGPYGSRSAAGSFPHLMHPRPPIQISSMASLPTQGSSLARNTGARRSRTSAESLMHDTTATESEQMRTWTASSSSNPDALALLPPSIAALGLDELLEDASHAPEDAHISASRSTSFALNDVSSDSLHSSATGASSKQIGGFSRPQEGFRVVGDAIMGALNLSGADGRSSGASGGSYSYSGGGDASNQNGSGGSSGYNEPSSRGIGGGGGLGRGNGDEEGEERKQEKERNRKANPLVDLIETETAYVAELSMIIRRVAAAWSRSNFPPPELDTMFRNIEAVYRVNRSFLKSLREIGPNPSSPKALGDLLMRWIDDLEAPYMRYCDNYLVDFDSWPAVQSNGRLPTLLTEISQPIAADGTPTIFSDKKRSPGDVWTLDALFALPQLRLKYYKKLYSRLLKSTQPGRSDHRLLVGANEKLDELLERSKRRISMSVLGDMLASLSARGSLASSVADSNGTSDLSRDRTSSATSASAGRASGASVPPPMPKSPQSSPPFPPASAPQAQTSESMLPPEEGRPQNGRDSEYFDLEQIEQRLDTSRTLDIFTMKPKKCQLQMNPPALPFKRGLRKSSDVVIYFTPLSTGQEIIVRRAHIFLLTDLFLICERMSPSERAERPNGPDMWLLYPPLAGKHLRVADLGGQGNILSVLVLKKEKLIIHTESRDSKEQWLNQFDECQQFANSLTLKVKTNTGPQSATGSPSSALGPQRVGGSAVSASTGSAGAATTPVLSPAISVTPSSQGINSASGVDQAFPFSPHSSSGSSLAREGSFTSVGSFPKQPLASRSSPDLRLPKSSPNSAPGSRSASPQPPMPGRGMQQGSPSRSSPALNPTSYNSTLSPPISPSMPSAPFTNGGPPRPNPQGNMARAPANGPLNNGQGFQPNGPNGFGGPSGPNGYGPRPVQYNNGQRPPPPPPPGAGYDAQPRQPSRRPSAPDLQSNSRQPMNGRARSVETSERTRSVTSEGSGGPPKLPSEMLKQQKSQDNANDHDISPPSSPRQTGPVRSTISAQMRCKLFLKQNHAQWKSLGNARLKLYHMMPTDVKQLVVENDRKTLISTIVLTDGVERVGKVGVAVELSDAGSRTGIIYMLQMRSEESAGGLFGQLLEGSDRSVILR